MRVVSVELSGWRNYHHQTLEIEPGTNVFIGENGQGKTNFVEAVVYAAMGRSHRTHLDATLVGNGNESAIVRMRVAHNSRSLEIDLSISSAGANTLRVNGNPTKRRDLARLLPLVIFAPEDMHLVRGEPDGRRGFLDHAFTEMSATAVSDIADFERTLRQRNALLKSLGGRTQPSSGSTLDTWTEALVSSATKVIAGRRTAVAALAERFSHHYAVIAGDGQLAALSLVESIGESVETAGIAAALSKRLDEKRSDEIERGTTLVGPHRDDLLITLNGLNARTHSSQGEAWSVALSLKLAAVDALRHSSVVGDPIVILDDVFAELDEGRRSRLSAHLSGIEQLIVTAADEASLPADLGGRRFRVAGGRIDA